MASTTIRYVDAIHPERVYAEAVGTTVPAKDSLVGLVSTDGAVIEFRIGMIVHRLGASETVTIHISPLHGYPR